jgi:heme/copper-type cytochrome/quinol oxidase subunit 2
MIKGTYCILVMGHIIEIDNLKQITPPLRVEQLWAQHGWGFTYRKLGKKEFFNKLAALRAEDASKSGEDVGTEGVLALRSDLLNHKSTIENRLIGPGFKFQEGYSLV